MINIFIIDDHPVFIDGIKSVFSNGDDKIKVTGWATSVKEALPKLKRFGAEIKEVIQSDIPELNRRSFVLIKKLNG